MNAGATQKIEAFLRSAHPSAQGSILESKDLFADGWLDSLLQLRLLSYLEEEFKVRVPPFQMTRKTFLSVDSIAELLEKNKK